MLVNRRELIKAGVLAGIAALIPSRLIAASGAFDAAFQNVAAEWWMSRALLTAHVGSKFKVRQLAAGRGGAPRLALRLDSVVNISKRENCDDCFSARFSAPIKQDLPQGTYNVSHPILGSFEAFMVPVDRPGRRQTYEIVVNRPPV